jgi:nucleoside 2-deoxyribosyltransferase
VRLATKAALRWLPGAGAEPPAAPLPPRVAFNGHPGPRRGFVFAAVSLPRLKALGRTLEVTVNDLILALTGSALRRYLLSYGELPASELVALVPVSTRAMGDVTTGNRLTFAPVGLATGPSDPLLRLRSIHQNALAATQRARDAVVDPLEAAGNLLLPGFVELIARTVIEASADVYTNSNLVVSSVRATPVPLYVAGALVEALYPLAPLNAGQGLNVTAISYADRLTFGFTHDPELLADPWTLADAIGPALDELEAAAARFTQPRMEDPPMANGHIVYCAGPMFSPGDFFEMQSIADALEGAGYETYLPQRDGIEVAKIMESLGGGGKGPTPPPGSPDPQLVTDLMRKAVFALDVYQLLSRCDCTVFNMNGRVPDEGSIAETSMAFATGKPIVIYKDDPITILMGLDNPLVQGLSYTWTYAASFPDVPAKLTEFLAQYEQLWGARPQPNLSGYLTGVVQIGAQVWAQLQELRAKYPNPDDPTKITFALIAWLLQNQAAFQKSFPSPTGAAPFKAFRSF